MFLRSAVVASLLIGSTSALSARPLLEHARPAPDSTLRHGPPQVALSFSETLSPSGSDAVVRNSSGGIVSSGKARVVDKARMQVPVKSLAPGKYRVEWLATSSDKRSNQGSFTFVIGNETTGRGSGTDRRRRH
jgi:methionine-rich copper-binding protein CopC